jgi:hypothetical protein
MQLKSAAKISYLELMKHENLNYSKSLTIFKITLYPNFC